MLAQNFKTPADLGIANAEFDALVKVLGMLEREELKHVGVNRLLEREELKHVGVNRLGGFGPFTGHFNMAFHNTVTECGTVCCIAGTASLLIGHPGMFRYNRTPGLRDLCCPATVRDWEAITPAQAAIALRNYLTHGEPRWDEAMAS